MRIATGVRLATGVLGATFLLALPASAALAQDTQPAAETAVAPSATTLKLPAGEYALDREHASLTWRIGHMGLSNYTARFTSFDATITLDPQDVTRSAVAVTIDATSVRTDYPFPEKEDFDKVIADKFLRAGEFPTISFKSTRLVATGADTGKLTGDLTLLGVTKAVTLDVKLNGAMEEHPMSKQPALGISAKGKINRMDFGLTALKGALSDEIELQIEAEFQKK